MKTIYFAHHRQNRFAILTVICSLGIGLTIPMTAQGASAGKEPFNFLFLDADARPAAMGGAYTALASDANALLYNPAGLGLLSGHQAVLMRNQHVAEVSQDYIALSLAPGFGFFLDRLSYGSIPRTTVSEPGGVGSFTPWDQAVGVGLGREVGGGLGLGLAAKYLASDIAGYSASGFAFDGGLLLRVPGSPLSAGLSVQNIGPPISYRSVPEPLPLNVRLGTALALDALGQALTLSLDASKERSEGALFSAGAEVLLGKRTSLRAGFNGRNEAGTGFTFGIGWGYEGLGLGYAFVPMGDLGTAHRASVSWRWGQEPRVAAADAAPEADKALKAIRP